MCKWRNRYIEGKADEYSSKRAWSSIGKQYPEGLTREVIRYTRQKVRNQTTRQHETKIRNGNKEWLRKAANTRRVNKGRTIQETEHKTNTERLGK